MVSIFLFNSFYGILRNFFSMIFSQKTIKKQYNFINKAWGKCYSLAKDDKMKYRLTIKNGQESFPKEIEPLQIMKSLILSI